MSEPVVTELNVADPQIFVRFTSGRLEVLHLLDQFDDPQRHEELVEALRVALSTGLHRHRTEQMQQLQAEFPPEAKYQREALAFARETLETALAVSAPVQSPRAWFPTQADGRDRSGAVHASVLMDEVVILEVPLHVMRDRRNAGHAVRAAVNLALERLERDTAEVIDKRGGEPSEPPNWPALATLAGRYRSRHR